MTRQGAVVLVAALVVGACAGGPRDADAPATAGVGTASSPDAGRTPGTGPTPRGGAAPDDASSAAGGAADASATGPTSPPAPDATPPTPGATREPPGPPVLVPDAVATAPPEGFGARRLPLSATGYPAPQPVPPEFVDRRLVTVDELPPPPDERFVATVGEVPPEVLARSTWVPGCPVAVEDLRYATVSFVGFDGLGHTGELLVHRDVVDDVVALFELLHAERVPIERMMVLGAEELSVREQRGDDNTTSAFECRAVAGGSAWSQHAYGRAVDVNPFHNPYRRERPEGVVVLPALASAYLDRSRDLPGQLDEGHPAVELMDELGWTWGGRWNSLVDYHHWECREGAPCDGG